MNKNFLISLLLYPICFLINKCTEKSNKYYFYSPLGLKGNIKYLYDFYLSKNESCYFITPDSIKKLTITEYIKLCISLSSSKTVFLSHGIGGLPISCFLTTRVQLWHGYPLKKILLKSQFDTVKYKLKLFNCIYLYLYRLRIKISYSYLITSDSILGRELIESFDYKKNKVLLYGSPSQEKAEKETIQNITETYKILYLPTWRDGTNDIIEILNSILESLDAEFLSKNNITIDIKLHPYDMDKLKNLHTNNYTKFISYDVKDMVSFYSNYNCLITDYSSACFEYSPIGGQVIFFTPDLNKYIECRGFTLDYKELATNNVNDIVDLKNAVVLAKNDNSKFLLNYKKYVGTSKNCMELIHDKFK